MRVLAASSLILVLSACTSEPSVGLHLDSTMQARTQGVVLHDGGELGNAGMFDQICVFDSERAEVVGDLDLGDSEERLLDAHGDLALAVTDQMVYEFTRTDLGVATPILSADAIAARVLDDGIAALVVEDGACGIAFDTSDVQAFYPVGFDCDRSTGFTADRASGTVFVGDGRDLTRVTADGQTITWPGEQATILAFDAQHQQVIMAMPGSSTVRAANMEGEQVWGVDLSGAVASLAAAEAEGIISVVVDQGAAGGEMVMVDGLDGVQVVSHLTPTIADVTFSSDGLSMALITPDQVHLYDVDPDLQPMATPTSYQASELGAVVGTGSAVGGSILAAAATAVFIE